MLIPDHMAVSEIGLLGAGSKKLGGILVFSLLLREQPEPKTSRFTVKRRSKNFIVEYSYSGFFKYQVV